MVEKSKYAKVTPAVQRVKKSGSGPDTEAIVDAVVTQRVVKSKARVQKKGLIERGVRSLVGPNGLPAVKNYVAREVMGPALKNMFVDIVISGVQMLVFKDEAPRRSYSSSRKSSESYGSYYKGGSSTRYTSERERDRRETRRDYDDAGAKQLLAPGVVLNDWCVTDRMDAQNVLNALKQVGYEYGIVKVREYYDMMGISSVYTDNNYGWKFDSIDGVRIRAVKGGYVLDLPPIEAI